MIDCPNGFMVNPENIHSCIKCGDRCFQPCEGMFNKVLLKITGNRNLTSINFFLISINKKNIGNRIEKIDDTYAFKKCTSIKNDLVISLHDNTNDLEGILEKNLGQIESIQGYLRISKSFSLQTLNFFKSLREIGGETLDRNNYSLYVFDNANLAELFYVNPNVTQPQLKILRGDVFFEMNPKLCLDKIYELKNYTNIKNIGSNSANELSNGDKAICQKETIIVNLLNRTDDRLQIKWTQFKPGDYRFLLGYEIWYKPV